MSQPFNTSLRRGGGEPRDLIARVDAEVRDRIGEAVDFVCLEAMADARRASGGSPLAPDSPTDRAEFDRRVEAFLGRLAEAMLPALDAEQRRSIAAADPATGRSGASGRADSPVAGDRLAGLVATQVALAKLLPDYWQRFEQVRVAYAAEPDAPTPPGSGRDRPRWLDRLLGR